MSGSPAVERTVAGRQTRSGRLRFTTVRSAAPLMVLLAGVGVLVVSVYLALALRIETPWIMVDELIYSELAKGIAEDGELLLRGEPTSHISFLYPVLIAPAWFASSMETTYVLAKAINVILITLASVPAYFWARRLMPQPYALVTTALVLLVPGLLYSGMMMTENAFFPAFLLATFAIAGALERSTLVRQAVALGAIALAVSIRFQGVALVGILLTAVFVDALLEWRAASRRLQEVVAARVRAFAPTLGLLLVAGAGYAIVKGVQGEPLSSGLGAYQVVSGADYSLVDTARWSLYHAAELCLAVGVIPVSAFLVLLGLAAWRGASSPAERAFLAVTASASVWIVITVASFASRFIPRIEERNMFHLFPLFLLALGLWLARGVPRRPLRIAIPAALAPAVLIPFLPLERFLNGTLLSDTFGLIPLLRLANELDGGVGTVEWIVIEAGFAAAGLFLILPRTLMIALAPPAVAAFFVLTSYAVSGAIRDYSRSLQGYTYVTDADWIDDRIGADADAAYVFGGGADAGGEASLLWQTEFWNRSLGTVYRVGPQDHGGFPGVNAEVEDSTGSIVAGGGQPVRSRYVVTTAPGFELAGELIAQNSRLSLYRTTGSVGVATTLSGLFGDGWTGPSASYTRYSSPGDRAGRVRVVVSRKGWGGPDVPSRVRIRVGPLGDGALRRVTGERRWVLHTAGERTFTLPTPRPPFRVELTVDPTFSPASYGFADSRQLGAQVSFTFVPGRR